ncbi:hypothetical protein FOXG_21683 [Fusarium oxysporum f. sp. lycopersici 4287]|uniref:Uncharacterized protein n=1 Tax=Fusarium oxysporum f. sp. lycopersici (strain 4287 / CBS 123668 / FGSC 9935 / NRRL 34936) TaxID=426428 RepID=A0A0J9WTR5_FUSO4|nr:hypothetical protein FOXG_21683 [Fusarium oxysporum f. sp. lycopersici 4287]KNB16492.1 hypothetical protein FOXG_21683 [Fusarium oxysporum f. sp. lycopersici 4287]
MPEGRQTTRALLPSIRQIVHGLPTPSQTPQLALVKGHGGVIPSLSSPPAELYIQDKFSRLQNKGTPKCEVARLISKSNAPDSLALRIGFVTQEKMNSGHGREPPASAKCLTNLEKAYLTPASRNCPSVDKRNLTSRSATNIQNSRASAHQPSAASRQHVTKRGLLSTNNARRLQHFPRGTENFLLHNPNDTHSRNQGTGTKFPRHSTTRHKQQVLPRSVVASSNKVSADRLLTGEVPIFAAAQVEQAPEPQTTDDNHAKT